MDNAQQVPELLTFATTMGVGGVLALAMFLFYRKDSKENAQRERDVAQAHATRLEGLLAAERERTGLVIALVREVAQVVQNHAAVSATLCTKLDRVFDERDGEDRRHRT